MIVSANVGDFFYGGGGVGWGCLVILFLDSSCSERKLEGERQRPVVGEGECVSESNK